MTKTVGLALGGGGARGWAHIGVIRALEEADIQISYLAGTSIGALVGAVYVADALDKLEAFADDIALQNLLSLMDVSFPSPGLIDGDRIHDFVAGYVLNKTMEDAAIPFRCVATNFLLKQEVILQTGLMVDAVRASISIPGIFAPVQKDKNIYLVDGGVVNPLPVSVVRAMGADIVIAVNLNKDPKTEKPHSSDESDQSSPPANRTEGEENHSENPSNDGDSGVLPTLSNRYEALKNVLQDKVDQWIPDPSTGLNIFDVLGNSINMMEQRVTEVNLSLYKPDLLIEPNLMEFGIFDFHQSKPMIQTGYDAAKAALPQLEELFASQNNDRDSA
ncbi:MAG TPA: patatin-like phospholipase family protein [Elainellaceae cyanobacterium]